MYVRLLKTGFVYNMVFCNRLSLLNIYLYTYNPLTYEKNVYPSVLVL